MHSDSRTLIPNLYVLFSHFNGIILYTLLFFFFPVDVSQIALRSIDIELTHLFFNS